MNKKYDVIVVGLGAMGSATLYQLSKCGVNALGIDQFDPPHTLGSSHGESRITRQVCGEGSQYFPFVQRSNEIWTELENASDDKLFYQTGGLIICPKEGGAQFHGQSDFVSGTATLAKQANIEYQILSADEVTSNFPAVQPQQNEHAYFENQAGILNPEQCIATQLDLAQQQGATIRTNEKVLQYETTQNGVTVQSEHGTYHADKLVLSTGAWMLDLIPDKYKSQLKIYRQAIYWFEATDVSDFAVDNFPWVLWIGETLDDFLAVFPIPPTGMSAVKMMTERYINPAHPNDLERNVTTSEIDEMYHTILRNRVNNITSTCVKSAICAYTVTPDEHFIIDFHPEIDRVIFASPCSGHGFKHSAAIGETLAQLALEGKSKLDISSFGLERFHTSLTH